MTRPSNSEENWALARAMADALERYLDHDMVYMGILVPGPKGYLRRTVSLGGLLSLLDSLREQAKLLTSSRVLELEEMGRRVEELRRLKPDRYWGKVRQEIQSHLNSLEWFLDDLKKREKIDQVAYPGEMSLYRQMHLLLDRARANGRTEMEDLQARASALDEPLKTVLNQNDSSERERQ